MTSATIQKSVSDMNISTHRPKFGIVRFPGSNCDQDAFHVCKEVFDSDVEYLWHADSSLKGADVVILPGGFSYGDYLRTGAVARFAPIMEAVQAHAERGGMVVGICNGFQILCEAQLLPGALVRNSNCKFICKYVGLRVENAETPFTTDYFSGQTLQIPVAHGEGCYLCDDETLQSMTKNHQILFRYSSASGELTEESNINGSLANIAGIANSRFNVMGMMPHPERACEKILGSADGRGVFTSIIKSFVQ